MEGSSTVEEKKVEDKEVEEVQNGVLGEPEAAAASPASKVASPVSEAISTPVTTTPPAVSAD